MVTSGVIYHFLRLISLPVDIRNICVLLAPAFSGLTAYATYLLTSEMSTSPSAGLLAAAFMGITPGYISRSVAGSYDNEAIAIFLLVYTFYLWIKAVKQGSVMWGALAALFYGYMVSAWGGYVFITNLLPLHAFVLICMGRYSARLYVSYTTWYAIGTLASMQIPFVGFLPIRSSEHMSALGKHNPLLCREHTNIYRCLRSPPNRRFCRVRSSTTSKQTVPDPPPQPGSTHFRGLIRRPCSPYSIRGHCSVDWSFLLSLGHRLCEDPHSHHCLRLRAPADRMASILFRLEPPHLALPSWCLPLLPHSQG